MAGGPATAVGVPAQALAAEPLSTRTPETGALPALRAATDPAALGGQYYGPGGRYEIKGHPRLVTSSPESYEVAVQQRLWAVSEELTGVTFPVVTSGAATTK